jgi:type III protein arginine methyltransferase
MLPVKLLTPFQAENDHNIKDTYNYMTVQADIRMPTRQFKALEDPYYNSAWRRAVEGAVKEIEDSETDCRVLNLGSGAGVQAVTALHAGARHVTAAERWLYLALATKEAMVENEIKEESYSVIYKRPTDLKIKEDLG